MTFPRAQLFIISLTLGMPVIAQEKQEDTKQSEKRVGNDKEKKPILDKRKIKLIVREKGTGRPIPRAEIRVGTESFYTTPEGQASISIAIDEKILYVRKKGYENQLVDIIQDQNEIDIFLFPGEPDDEEIVITGKRRPEVSKKTVTVKETKRIAPQGDPAQITKLLPGVQSRGFSSEVIIRGSAPEDSSYFIDGIRVPNIFHQVQNLSIISDKLLREVDFNAGGFGPQYGDASGGIVTLRTTDEVPDFAMTEFKVNVPFYLGIYHESPLNEQSSLAFAARKSLLEYILPSALPEDSQTTVVPFFTDLNGRYLLKDDKGHYKLTAIYSRDGLSLATPFDESDREDGKIDVSFNNQFAVIGLERKYRISNDWTNTVTPYLRWSRIKVNAGQDSFYLNNEVFTVRNELRYRLGRRRYLYFGVEPSAFKVNVEATAPVVDNDDPFADREDAERISAERNIRGYDIGAWVSADFAFDSLIIQPGLRGTYDYLIRRTAIDPRVSLRRAINDAHTIKAAIGRYSIAPVPQESSEEFGNPNLGFEHSNHIVLGIDSDWTQRWRSEVQIFSKRTYKLIFSSPNEDRYSGTGTRETNGFELFIRRNLTEKFFGWLSYTYSRSRERKSDNTDWFISEFDQTHNAQIIGSYRVLANLDLGMRLKYTTGFPYTPVEGSIYKAILDKYQPVYNPQSLYAERLPDNHSIDLFATYDSLFDYWKLSYQVGVQFLAFTEQATNIQYNYDYSKEEFIRTLPPIPYIQVTGEF